MPGIVAFQAEVTTISAHAFWLLLGTEALAVPFNQFPGFKNATVEQITCVEQPTANHLYYVDLAAESLRRPQAIPLVSRSAA